MAAVGMLHGVGGQFRCAGDQVVTRRALGQEAGEFFEGYELIEPGLVDISTWRPDGTNEEQSAEWIEYGGVARKP